MAATANSAGAGPRRADAATRTRTPRPGAATGPERGDELERDVVREDDVEDDDQQRGEREVELPGREARRSSRATTRRGASGSRWSRRYAGNHTCAPVSPPVAVVSRNSSFGLELHEDVDAAGGDDREARSSLEALRPAPSRAPCWRVASPGWSVVASRRVDRLTRCDHPAQHSQARLPRQARQRARSAAAARARARCRAAIGPVGGLPRLRLAATAPPERESRSPTCMRISTSAALEHREQCIGNLPVSPTRATCIGRDRAENLERRRDRWRDPCEVRNRTYQANEEHDGQGVEAHVQQDRARQLCRCGRPGYPRRGPAG